MLYNDQSNNTPTQHHSPVSIQHHHQGAEVPHPAPMYQQQQSAQYVPMYPTYYQQQEQGYSPHMMAPPPPTQFYPYGSRNPVYDQELKSEERMALVFFILGFFVGGLFWVLCYFMYRKSASRVARSYAQTSGGLLLLGLVIGVCCSLAMLVYQLIVSAHDLPYHIQ